MQIIRTLGLILLALSFVAAGFYAGMKKKSALRDLSELCALIAHVRREIVWSSEELPDVFSSYFPPDAPQRAFFRSGDYEKALAFYNLSPSDRAEALRFFCALGSGVPEEEEKRCDRILSILLPHAEQQKKELPEKRKVSVTLGICAAAILLLLFL